MEEARQKLSPKVMKKGRKNKREIYREKKKSGRKKKRRQEPVVNFEYPKETVQL